MENKCPDVEETIHSHMRSSSQVYEEQACANESCKSSPPLEMSNRSAPTVQYDTYAHHGRNILNGFHEKMKKAQGVTPIIPARLRASTVPLSVSEKGVGKVGILGAGK